MNPRSLVINSGVAAALTIATGTIATTGAGSSYVVDTEGASSSDDLDTINGGADGDIIYLRSTADARDVVIKHNTGNIWNPQNNNGLNRNITLDTTTDFAILRYSSSLGYWIIMSSSFNNFVTSRAATGYMEYPNGFKEQWGVSSIAGNDRATLTFPVAFTTAVYVAIATNREDNVNADATIAYAVTLTQISIANGSGSTENCYYFAKGY